MTSFLDVIAHDESETALARRKATVLAKQRVDRMFGAFIKSAGRAAFDYCGEDINGVVKVACDEVGCDDFSNVYKAVNDSLFDDPIFVRTASFEVESARMPKMCPFHKDVVDISLASGNAQAGFEALRDHWGGPRHCQGDGYEGDKCKFKPQMTTQAFWDEKAEKAEQRRKERAEAEPVDEQVETPEEITEPVAEEPTTEPTETEQGDGAEVIDFPIQDAADGAEEGAEVPMSMAASTKQADGGPVPVMDKRKWTPQSVPFLDVDDDDGRWPTRRKDVVEPIKPENADKLTEIGEATTERVDVTKDGGPEKTEQGGTFTGGPTTAVSSTIPNDVDKNPITALVQGEYDGFLPQHEVQQAIAASRR